jgi:hypothetical protein
MKTNTAFALFIFGLILTMFGVGGVENSVTDSELLAGVAVSALGLGIMYSGTLALRVADYYDQRG